MAHLLSLPPSHHAALLGIPCVLYLLSGLAAQLASAKTRSLAQAWTLAISAAIASLLFALLSSVDALLRINSPTPQIDSAFNLGPLHLSFRFDTLASLMLLLVTFLGWVIVSYSRAYMAGDPNERAYLGHLTRTLAAVSLLVVTNNLLVFLAAWILTSLSLHGLLTLYPNRQAAVIAAHKKFLASRLGDLTLLAAVLLLGTNAGSFEIDQLINHLATLQPIPAPIHAAACLLAISAVIKCAQLPLHGWLIQVMEAPTPVSALLHAGVVNLGGFMLIRLAPVLNTTYAAQLLLVIIGSLTATIAALVMTTRISIKVHLAWSTCAQMGFMLLECGLGLYALAFLHLLAHSLYKAHAFLASGGTVQQSQLKRMLPPRPPISAPTQFASACLGILIAAVTAAVVARAISHSASPTPALFLCILIAGLAIAGILASIIATRTLVASLILAASALAVTILYFAYDALFHTILPAPSLTPHTCACLT